MSKDINKSHKYTVVGLWISGIGLGVSLLFNVLNNMDIKISEYFPGLSWTFLDFPGLSWTFLWSDLDSGATRLYW